MGLHIVRNSPPHQNEAPLGKFLSIVDVQHFPNVIADWSK